MKDFKLLALLESEASDSLADNIAKEILDNCDYLKEPALRPSFQKILDYDKPLETEDDRSAFRGALHKLPLGLLYRGITKPRAFEHFPMRSGRRPRDSSLQLHEILGQWMENKFGVDFRSNAYFATGNIVAAKTYHVGQGIGICFPKGKTQFLYSTVIEDATTSFDHDNASMDSPFFDYVLKNRNKEQQQEIMQQGEEYVNTLEEFLNARRAKPLYIKGTKRNDLFHAAQTRNEIMLNSPEGFYIVDPIFPLGCTIIRKLAELVLK